MPTYTTEQKLQFKINSLEKQKSFAFYKYYEECKKEHTDYIDLYEKYKKMFEELEQLTEPPIHIINELKELYEKDKKIIECPICLEIIPTENISFSTCLHKFCDCCLEQLKKEEMPKCAVCRKKLYVNKKV